MKPHQTLRRIARSSYCWVLLLVLCATATAQPAGVIDYLPPLGSTPLNSVVLLESATGSVQVYSATLTPISDTARTLIAAGAPARPPQNSFGVAFLTDPLREAPKVQTWSADAYTINAMSEQVLRQDILDLDQSLQAERIRSVDVQDRAREYERAIIEALALAELREKKEEQRELERSIFEKQREILRLERVIERGRQFDAPENITAMRLELGSHLRETAQVTAAADHLTRRKLDAARGRVRAKLKLIEQLKAEDSEALARELLSLRAKRRELESRLGVSRRDAQEF